MRTLNPIEVSKVSGGELEYSVNVGPFGATGTAQDFGNAFKAYGKFAPFSGIAYIGDLFDLYDLMAK